jgi:cytochrome o ubiquinol oxidase subunit 2
MTCMPFLLARRGLILLSLGLLGGCDMVVMDPSGYIAAQQADLIIISTLLMLLIIIPVIILTVVFAWRYRQQNTAATYDPDWDHSTRLELVIWGAPLLIIIALGLITWVSTHQLDPYRPLEEIEAGRPIPAGTEPLIVEVVALDWKWLFIYPEQGIATVNQLVTPVDVPIRFHITASTVMNSFYIPALAGQVYSMPGMQTTLNAVLNETGEFEGFSANYSGAGFSDMRFSYQGVTAEDFERWVQATKADKGVLDRAEYRQLEKPSQDVPARQYGSVAPGLFDRIVERCVDPEAVCMGEMATADRRAAEGMQHD